MKIKILYFLLALSSVCAALSPASAQVVPEFSADRPGATTGPGILPRGRVQLETGLGWERSALDGPWTTTWTVNTSMLRWGFSDFAELRLQANYLISEGEEGRRFGFDSVFFGTKARLCEGSGILPEMALMANILVPGRRGSAFLSEHWGGQIGLLCENELAPWCSLGYEADLIWEGDGRPEVFFGACLGFQPWERFSFQVEEFNIGSDEGLQCWSELSCAWQVSPRVQLDFATDISLNAPERCAILMFGLSWQITRQ